MPGSDDWLPPPFEQFVAAHLHAAAIFVALDGGEVIGYAKLTARADGRTGDHGMTAVRREARNRGVATALKRAQIAWAKEHGFERLTAANEERNAAMQHINSLLGYRLHSRARAPAGTRSVNAATLTARMVRGSHIAAIVAAVSIALVAPGVAGAGTPTPSLQPTATQKLWKKLVQRRTLAATNADCMRAVFYAPTDWLRLATTLAAHNVSCAQYYVSIPPLAADKTTFRPDQPWRIRALGANFHAVAEISYNGWSRWVADNGETWFDAGVEARRRMAAQGFDISAGDTWAINESSSAVRTGTGNARQNLRDLLRGLYTEPAATASRESCSSSASARPARASRPTRERCSSGSPTARSGTT